MLSMRLAAFEGFYVLFKQIKALNKLLRIVKSWNSFSKASLRAL